MTVIRLALILALLAAPAAAGCPDPAAWAFAAGRASLGHPATLSIHQGSSAQAIMDRLATAAGRPTLPDVRTVLAVDGERPHVAVGVFGRHACLSLRVERRTWAESVGAVVGWPM